MTLPLLTELERAGIRIEAQGDRLDIDAPRGVLTPDLLDRLRRHKAQLLDLLTSPAPADESDPQPQVADPAGDCEPTDTPAPGPDGWPAEPENRNRRLPVGTRTDCGLCGGNQWVRDHHGNIVCLVCFRPAKGRCVCGGRLWSVRLPSTSSFKRRIECEACRLVARFEGKQRGSG